MKVSVVIPAYNEGGYIEACLEHLSKQTVMPDEIIVVDNNSKDDTVEKARRFGVKVISEKEQGISYARNAGFDTAQYDIICRCDGDSRVPPDWIETIKNHFGAQPSLVGLTGPGQVYDHISIINSSPLIQSVTYHTLSRLLLGYDVLFGSNMAIPQRIWQSVRNEVCMDNTLVHEDMDLAIHIHPLGEILFDPKMIVGISSRRHKADPTHIIEYFHRWYKTIRHHR